MFIMLLGFFFFILRKKNGCDSRIKTPFYLHAKTNTQKVSVENQI